MLKSPVLQQKLIWIFLSNNIDKTNYFWYIFIMKRTIIIGDVHGCLNEIKQLLSLVSYDKNKDRLIFLGDIVDRGPNSAGCVSLARTLDAESVMGNHDIKYSKYYKHEKKVKKEKNYKNPMNFNSERLKVYESLSKDDLKWIRDLPYKIYLKEIDTLLVHAGVSNKFPPLFQPKKHYIYCRFLDKETGNLTKLNKDYSKPNNSFFWTDEYCYATNIVYGHQVVDLKNPRVITNEAGGTTIGIDTGCVYGGHLTALIIEKDGTRRFEQVKSSFNYKEFKLNKI